MKLITTYGILFEFSAVLSKIPSMPWVSEMNANILWEILRVKLSPVHDEVIILPRGDIFSWSNGSTVCTKGRNNLSSSQDVEASSSLYNVCALYLPFVRFKCTMGRVIIPGGWGGGLWIRRSTKSQIAVLVRQRGKFFKHPIRIRSG